jgi:hypothetical protein
MVCQSGSGKGRKKKLEKCDVMDAGSNKRMVADFP